ncbi:hypothetical protein ACCT03_13025 [Rhizobium johnstonii]|uniref:Uncharacterized protein n=1 Tax=Rhizobium leguminosarum bv. viciae TaxID=387 RepID=A0A8G2IZ72_RHILV|nr:hypothetical protein [Rhizobium leguminosarum]MBY5379869.1 hypothetical protein [Rhizobium leguminosarum]MBY5430526.1 hypothetical protein [Rhizobium leguminosarum]MCA2431803.1 hypothetical protein [Rhizobium leguminosarum]NEH68016.1 hypothetical protein [Rhizobium leguminosarum]NEK41499.1 hypothetical protein [Rhizobium leguminosarum]
MSRKARRKFEVFWCAAYSAALHKRRIGNFVELTPNLAGTIIAICHSTDYQTRASSNGLNTFGRVRQSL